MKPRLAAMLAGIEGADPDGWWEAVSILHEGLKLTRGVVRRVAAVVRGSQDFNQRHAAIYILGQATPAPAAGEALFEIFNNVTIHPELRGLAAEWLSYFEGSLGKATLRKAYIKGLADPAASVRFWCIYGLDRVGAAPARRQLQELAANDHRACPLWSNLQTVSTEAKWALAGLDDLPLRDRLAPGPFHKFVQPARPAPASFLRRAIDLAAANVRDGNGGPFGAVIVREKEIVGEGANRVVLFNDPTAHAEIVAIRETCRVLQTFDLSGCQIYCSCEPNPMSLGAIYWARLSRIYYAATSQDAARAGFADLHLYAEVSAPIAQRSIPTRNLSRRQGREPFDAWNLAEGKIRY